MKRDRSRKIMDRNYMQSKTVSPDTLIKRKNEEIVFVKTHCFCIPKHVQHIYKDDSNLEK